MTISKLHEISLWCAGFDFAEEHCMTCRYSRNVVLALKAHVARLGEEKCAFVRVMVFANKVSAHLVVFHPSGYLILLDVMGWMHGCYVALKCRKEKSQSMRWMCGRSGPDRFLEQSADRPVHKTTAKIFLASVQ